jgi:hypothetical protein
MKKAFWGARLHDTMSFNNAPIRTPPDRVPLFPFAAEARVEFLLLPFAL